ncbi:MAG TPA: hypothetical protein VLS95_08075 [Arthrobacter sp.]|nr:hypothetical protein [Arthrobacter sp.]
MSYERRLAFNLRSRGLSEPEVAEVIDELRAHQATAATPAEAEFGTAEQYAKQFPKMKRRSRGQIIVTVGTILAIAYVLFAVLLALLFRVDIRDYVGPITLQPGLVLIVAAFVAGFLTDYFRPVQSSAKAR